MEDPSSARRHAAVVLAIGAAPPHPIVFVARADHLRHHPGQIALPGGTADPTDPSLEHTALRELEEEVGIPAARVRLIGTLPSFSQRRGGRFHINAFVGIVAPGTRLVIDPAETAAVFEVPLAEIVAPGAVHQGIEVFEGRQIETWHFDYGVMHVWGATGYILSTFVTACADAKSPLRFALDAAGITPLCPDRS
jgi:8-oxo-dGTP pyrophosphatase MutT (NUDIX family)